MFARTYFPSAAGSVVVPNTAVMPTAGYAHSGYAHSGYGHPGYATSAYAYPAAPMSAPVMMQTFPRPAPVVVPTTAAYGYASPMHMPYYGGAPTVIMSSRSKWRRKRHSRFFDY